MTGRAVRVAGLLLAAIAPGTVAPDAGAQADEKMAMTRVRLTTEAGLADGCTRLGVVRDDSIADLRRKVVKLGGNTAVLSFGGSENLAMIFGEVFRCVDPPAAASPGTASPGMAPSRLPLPPPPPAPGPPR